MYTSACNFKRPSLLTIPSHLYAFVWSAVRMPTGSSSSACGTSPFSFISPLFALRSPTLLLFARDGDVDAAAMTHKSYHTNVEMSLHTRRGSIRRCGRRRIQQSLGASQR